MHTLSSLRAGELAGIERLDLCCGLTEFPSEIFDLADTLEILNLSGNRLSSLPDDLYRLHRLRVIFCSDNDFTRVPEVLGRCQNLEMIGFKANQISEFPAAALPERLRWLILTDNRLREIPAEIGKCSRLQKLMLAGNRLENLPTELAACKNLELLRIAANRFEHLPDWLFDMPRLAWLACSGNPCSDRSEAEALEHLHIAEVEWHALTLQHKLGEGASGVIYRAHHHANGHGKYAPPDDETCHARNPRYALPHLGSSLRSPLPQAGEGANGSLREFHVNDEPVAVKMFKGALTSDGLPRSEKAASIAAGTHPGLIPIVGKVSAHPEQTPGLVMSLIDPCFRNLAGPPSLESCTRDIYPKDLRFTLPVALNIAQGIASVAEHLHAQGIMHGDLYAHNILWNDEGDCLLGDFGAASFLPRHDARQAAALQRIEVRAYSCLLEELLDRCDAAPEDMAALHALRQRCDRAETNLRPLFAEIRSELAKLAV